MFGGHAAVVRVAATQATPGMTAIVGPNGQMVAVGGDGYIGDVIGAVGNMAGIPPIAVSVSGAASMANAN